MRLRRLRQLAARRANCRTFDADAASDAADAGAMASTNAEVHLDKILRLLKAAGVDFAGNRNQRFARLEPIGSSGMLHAEGAWIGADETSGWPCRLGPRSAT
jgi:hypothetical protein